MTTCGNFSRQKNMMNMIRKRSVIAVAAVLIAISSAAAIIAISYLRDGSAEYELTVYRTGCGWGYDIVCNGRTVIHQPFIPALPGEKVFPDRRSARKVAGHVAAKIRAGESPAVSTEEILELMPEFRR